MWYSLFLALFGLPRLGETRRGGKNHKNQSRMKIVIIGGTGLIGRQLEAMLQDKYEVLAASPGTGVNTLTKEGLNEAFQNASVVIDVSNSPSFADEDVMACFKISTEHLLAAEAEAGVEHHIVLSVVGTRQFQANP